ncbi:MAG: hypothetical protein H8D50_01420 [Thaumarchaeota archaeon]|nr:hypothetical protein [Nitrososphaerota archaeon]
MVSKQKKNILLKVLKRHGRLSRNKFLREIEKLNKESSIEYDISPQTFQSGLKELADDGQIIREEVLIGKMKWVFYSLPKILEFEKEEIKELEIHYQTLYKIAKALRDHDFILPEIGSDNLERFSSLDFESMAKTGNVERVGFIVKDQKELDEIERDYTLFILAEIILQRSELNTLRKLIPETKHSTIIRNAASMDDSMGLWINEIKTAYKIKPHELFNEIKSVHNSHFGRTRGDAFLGLIDDFCPGEYHVYLKFDPARFMVDQMKKAGMKSLKLPKILAKSLDTDYWDR